jgi:hypothetical protein
MCACCAFNLQTLLPTRQDARIHGIGILQTIVCIPTPAIVLSVCNLSCFNGKGLISGSGCRRDPSELYGIIVLRMRFSGSKSTAVGLVGKGIRIIWLASYMRNW